MYRRKKKQKKGRNKNYQLHERREVHSMTDVTVQEVAHNPRPVVSCRKKHFMTPSVLTKHTDVEEVPEEVEDLDLKGGKEFENWYDRDVTDFDEYLGERQLRRSALDQGSKKNDRNRSKSDEDVDVSQGRDYPADLWYILADFIAPEDVGRFSALCRGSFHVTNSVSFWRKLYFRWYADKDFLPPPLRPYHIKYSEECLRAKVIGALYRMYPPFRERNHPGMLDFTKVESYNIIGSTCLYSYYQGRVGNNFCHFIKFRRLPTAQEQNVRNSLTDSPSLWSNPCDGEVMLKVTCPVFQYFTCEQIMGLQLASVSLSVAHDMCYNRFKMEFVRHCYPSKRISAKGNRTVVTLEPVICVSVLNWWQTTFLDNFESNSFSSRRRGSPASSDSLWDG